MNIITKVLNKSETILKRFRRSYALNNLDIKLEKYLNFENGFFIEAGANNGVEQSNTLRLEKHRGWKGLLVEPVPELAAQCKLNRPNCIVENYALVSSDYKNNFVDMRYSNLMSMVKGAMKSEEEELNHIKSGCEIQNIESYELRVAARTLSSILDDHQITKVDFLSLDVEGFELQVLKGIDFDKHKPTWIMVEARYRTEIESFLKPRYESVANLSFHDILYKLK